jgi:hypothetical protein
MRALVLSSLVVSLCVVPAHAETRFALVELRVDVQKLPPSERTVLRKLVEAAQIMDALYLRQVWAGNETMLLRLVERATPTAEPSDGFRTSRRAALVELGDFLVFKGPWNRLDHDRPFVPGAPAKPPQANFYPGDATKAEVEAWLKTLPDAARTQATGFYTTIRRGLDGKLTIVPYAVEYQPELERAAALLREAAAATTNASLKAFLNARAQAFLSNDYYASEVAWMALDGAVEPTIGPYETYEDEWFSAKAAFEAYVTVRDDAETKKLAKLSSVLQDVENHLPIDPAMRNPKLGASAPIRVVNELYAGGDARHGVMTAAFNLPNDERVTKEKGTKRVMLKNVQEAKFERVLKPIAGVALSTADRAAISFDAFFTHILMHELMHGLGPHEVKGAPKPTTPRLALEESYSAIEEAKADISGLWAMQYLIDKKVLDASLERAMYVTYLASAFRSIRFGITEAHGKGQALQLNFLLDAGAVKVQPDGTFALVAGKVKPAVEELTRTLMTIEGKGDREAAKALLAKMAVVRPEVQRVLDRLKEVPVDISPRYVTAEELMASSK